ncbi:hypothetical protein ACHAWO_005575 [Cyclotella atomus]|uniref:RRM domain-containing protein n=1 Tax=Cyclotella atomus TaxID=382360 RepID=A0ABD3NLC5_9STRA
MSGAGGKMPCPKGSSGCNNPTSNQIDILENNFKFYHAWTPTTFEEHEQSYSSVKVNSSRNETTNSILVSGLPDAAQQNCSESNLSEFFSAFGPVIGVEIAIIRQSYIVRFEYGSDGAQNAFNSQPIKMFGNVLNIELKQNDKVEKPAAAPFPLLVASPKHGAWYKKLPKKSYLKPSTTPKAGTMGKLAAAASQLIADNFNPLSTELSAPRVNPGEQQNKSHQKLPSSSLHSLLSPTGHDPLFDDESDVTGDPFRNPENGESSAHTTDMSSPKHFHCDDALPTWVWAPSVVDGVADMSVAEKELSNALQLGRASNSHKPLYALVSSPVDAAGEKCTIEDTNLLLLHKRSTVSITEKSSGEQLGSYTLYQARHPFLAPILSVTKCSTESAQSSRVESFVSVFDITPSCHQPLHELLRTGDLLTKPLFPGIEGHECKPHCNQNAGIKRQQMQGITSPFSWFQTENGDQELCTCRTIFDRGRDESNLTVQDKMFRAELRQFRSSTSTMFQMLTEQEVFDDLRKLRLLPQTSSYHPQVYTRFNQTSMMYKTGSTYHANVADLRIRFLALQLFHAVNFFHSKGLTLGDQLRPDRIFVDREGWIRLAFPIVQMNVTAESSSITIDRFENERKSFELKHAETSSTNKDRRFIFDRYDGVDNQANESSIIASASTIIPYPGYGLVPYAQWQKGHVTNLAYLLMLNAAAGRTVGDQINPPILPWVTDFTSRIEFDDDSTMVEETELESPWRDLTKSKYRLHKGDEQLDQSYLHASPSHHVPETISDLTVSLQS